MKKDIKGLTLEEMIVNAVLNPHKKFRHRYWRANEYVYWSQKSNTHHFRDEEDDLFELWEYSTYLDGWKEVTNESIL